MQSSGVGCQKEDTIRDAHILQYQGSVDENGSPSPTPAPPPDCRTFFGKTRSRIKTDIERLDKDAFEFMRLYDSNPQSAEDRFTQLYPGSWVIHGNNGQGYFQDLRDLWAQMLKNGPLEKGSHVKVSLKIYQGERARESDTSFEKRKRPTLNHEDKDHFHYYYGTTVRPFLRTTPISGETCRRRRE